MIAPTDMTLAPEFEIWARSIGKTDRDLEKSVHGYIWRTEAQMFEAFKAGRARVAELEHALSFYADATRYRGPNQGIVEGVVDHFTPPDAAYCQDVSRDSGAIARAALGDHALEGWALVPVKSTPAIEKAIKEVAPRWFAPSVWASLLEAAKPEPEAKPRCPACQYQYGHAIGCEHNPVDLALKADNESSGMNSGDLIAAMYRDGAGS